MKHERTSYAFLMEMIWVCAFFLICASIFVMVFAKAEQVSRQAEVLNQAVQAVSNAMEESLSLYDQSDSSEIPLKYSTEDFSIGIECSAIDDGLYTVTVKATDPSDGTVIYSLTGARAVLEGGAS